MLTVFDVDSLKNTIDKLNAESLKSEVYSNPSLSASINKKLKYVQNEYDKLVKFSSRISDVEGFIDLLQVEEDEDLLKSLNQELDALQKDVHELYLATLINGEYDSNNAIIKIHSGAGGTEACDWVNMLYRMYTMFLQKNDFDVSVIDTLAGDEAGIKSITFKVIGASAYGYLKSEMGVHRLVRISPFDSNKRRHTSFASVEVMPEIDNSVNIVLREEDLKIDVYRASGAGGQHVNTTDSAVRITHIPTGIIVACQTERSQIQNRETALSMLKSKLVSLELDKKMKEALSLKGEAKKIEWGSQIRSYVFCPYTLVKDHRTGCETSDVDAVMNGKIDDFIFEFLKYIK